MGIVYIAVQDNPSRRVALKVIRPGAGGRSLLKRFQREGQLLGRLQHPGIAQIFEAGVAQLGEPGQPGSIELPFLAMELVEGVTLSRFAAERRLGTRARLELMAKVCEAVEHAHQRGLIHRDLKPGNILVTDAGEPKVLDFGVARALDQAPTVTAATEAGQLIGTVAYMSPEQVGGDQAALDTRSDVYTLGVILYELLCGRLPHQVRTRTVLEAAREIRESEPARPSTIGRGFRGDVETIMLRALQKDRERRYPSAAALAGDLRRYLAGEPILARQDSALYLLNKKLRRYRWAVGAGVVFLSLVVGFGAWAAVQARAFEALAVKESLARGQAVAHEREVQEQLRISDVERGRMLGINANLLGAEQALWSAFAERPGAPDTIWALNSWSR
jgi:eukaryotic-like serine/threonine-protein kinase